MKAEESNPVQMNRVKHKEEPSMGFVMNSLVSSSIVLLIFMVMLNSLHNNYQGNEMENSIIVDKSDDTTNENSLLTPNLEQANLENKFCYKLSVKSDNLIELKCPSMYKVFISLKNGCSDLTDKNHFCLVKENRFKIKSLGENVSEHNSKNITIDNGIFHYEPIKEDISTKEIKTDEYNENIKGKVEENDSSVVYLLIGFLLIMSTVVSILEFYRERKFNFFKPGDDAQEPNLPSEALGGNRRMSIVDLTVSRHARKESMSLRESNSSISATGRPPPLLRRSSFPAQVPEVIRGRARITQRQHTWSPQGTSSPPTSSRRISVDLAEEDSSSSPDRRRVRIIRRH